MVFVNRDPTQTTFLRNRFAGNLRGRLTAVRKKIRYAIVKDDILRLKRQETAVLPVDPVRQIERFEQFVERVVGEALEARSAATAVGLAYGAGVRMANKDAGKAVKLAANEEGDPEVDPVHVAAVALLVAAFLRRLKGRGRSLADRIVNLGAKAVVVGWTIEELATAVDAEISKEKTGLTVLAVTTVVEVFNEALLNRFGQLGFREVTAVVEIVTAGDRRVCPTCRGLQGVRYTIEQARGIIPVHPRCRCRWTVVGSV